jgi:DNA-binding beta-propeller fold protein YncE
MVDPTGIALDGSGNVYVADANNAVVEELKPSG